MFSPTKLFGNVLHRLMCLIFLSVLESSDAECKKPVICVLTDKSHVDFANWSRAIESASDFFSILMFGLADTLNTYWKTLAAKPEIWWAMRSGLTEDEQKLMTECDSFAGLTGQSDEQKGKIIQRRGPMKKLKVWWSIFLETSWVSFTYYYI